MLEEVVKTALSIWLVVVVVKTDVEYGLEVLDVASDVVEESIVLELVLLSVDVV